MNSLIHQAVRDNQRFLFVTSIVMQASLLANVSKSENIWSKESGFGREGVRFAMDDMDETRLMLVRQTA